jgi:hypothetical protein
LPRYTESAPKAKAKPTAKPPTKPRAKPPTKTFAKLFGKENVNLKNAQPNKPKRTHKAKAPKDAKTKIKETEAKNKEKKGGGTGSGGVGGGASIAKGDTVTTEWGPAFVTEVYPDGDLAVQFTAVGDDIYTVSPAELPAESAASTKLAIKKSKKGNKEGEKKSKKKGKQERKVGSKESKKGKGGKKGEQESETEKSKAGGKGKGKAKDVQAIVISDASSDDEPLSAMQGKVAQEPIEVAGPAEPKEVTWPVLPPPLPSSPPTSQPLLDTETEGESDDDVPPPLLKGNITEVYLAQS